MCPFKEASKQVGGDFWAAQWVESAARMRETEMLTKRMVHWRTSGSRIDSAPFVLLRLLIK